MPEPESELLQLMKLRHKLIRPSGNTTGPPVRGLGTAAGGRQCQTTFV
jgi:hypothetical protein